MQPTKELISVIVPVYKVEAYLDQCVQSLVDQTYENLEILLVDDGSPDRSGAMCDAWAAKDARIKVIHAENGGSGRARNLALRVAKGEYIAFVDSDDYIAPGMLDDLLAALHRLPGTDIAECDYAVVHDREDGAAAFRPGSRFSVHTPSEALKMMLEGTAFRQMIWNKLYRKDVVQGIFFPEGTLIDDEFFTYQLLGRARQLARIDAVYYAYRQQGDSLTHSTYSKKWLSGIDAKCQRQQYLKANFPELESAGKFELIFSCLFNGQIALTSLSGKERKEILSILSRIVTQNKAGLKDIKGQPLTYKFWLLLSRHHFVLTCRIRNRLGIGRRRL